MDIDVRKVITCIEVTIKSERTTIETGLMDEQEAKDFARKLISAAEEILSILP